jgi:hypothetical protein
LRPLCRQSLRNARPAATQTANGQGIAPDAGQYALLELLPYVLAQLRYLLIQKRVLLAQTLFQEIRPRQLPLTNALQLRQKLLTLTAQHRRQLRSNIALTAWPQLTLGNALALLPNEVKKRRLLRVNE